MTAQDFAAQARLRELHRHNKEPNSGNDSGACGVSWTERRKKWRAYVNYNGKTEWLGEFRDRDTAIDVVNKRRAEIRGEDEDD